MENKTAKQQAIEKAYGEKWVKVKDYIDEYYGSVPTFPHICDDVHWDDTFYWKILGYSYEEIEDIYGDCEPSRWRPKSLQGIETNNNWIRIESEEDLPKTSAQLYKVYRDKSLIGRDSLDFSYSYSSLKVGTLYNQRLITHYKPIELELLPIY